MASIEIISTCLTFNVCTAMSCIAVDAQPASFQDGAWSKAGGLLASTSIDANDFLSKMKRPPFGPLTPDVS